MAKLKKKYLIYGKVEEKKIPDIWQGSIRRAVAWELTH